VISFFRENKTVRDTVLSVIAALFCIGAVIGGAQPKSAISVGKRQLDAHRLQSQYHHIIKEHPEVDKKVLEQELMSQAIATLKQYQHIENLGFTPSSDQLKKVLSENLSGNISFKDFAATQHLNSKQLLLSIRDQLAFSQLQQSITQSSINTAKQQKLHAHTISQVRHYTDIDLSNVEYEDDESAYKAIYQQQQFKHPKQYHYTYVDITPETLNLEKTTNEMQENYFEKNMDQYADEDYEYQITTYIPSQNSPSVFKTWPHDIQLALSSFKESNPNLRIQTDTYHKKRSEMAKEHQVLSQLKPGEHRVIHNQKIFKVISLLQKQSSKTLDPNLKAQLDADLEQSHYHHQLQTNIELISEMAYTQPKSLEKLAKHYHLTVYKGMTTDPSIFGKLTEDTDFTEKRYISESVEHSPLHHQFFQITHIQDEQKKTYLDALDDIKQVYKEKILYPQLVEKLQTASLEEIDALCQKYHLKIETRNTKDKPLPTVFTLITNYDNPKPSILDKTHWIQLQEIEYPEGDQDMTPLIQKLDNDIFLSSL